MQPYHPTFKPLMAIAIAAVFLPSGNAAPTYSPGDLFLGFHQTGNTTKEYVINLGQASVFRDAAAPFTLSLNLTSFNTDMTNAFGASWKTVGNISWGFVGTTQNTATAGDPARLIYVSEPLGTIPTNSSSQSGPANTIIGFKNYWQGLSAGIEGTVPNSSIQDPNNSSAWTTLITASSAFGSSALNPIEDLLSNNLELFRVPQSSTPSVTDEGRFSMNINTGAISFTPTPEPSSAVMLVLALGGGLGLRRFRRRDLSHV